jgi:Ca-activated chloride channel family protein
MLEDAVERLTTARRTAIGSGILKSIDAIAEIDENVSPSITGAASVTPPTPLPQGGYAPAIIVLLTDGVSNVGPRPLDAARQAADRGIRVYTIGFGTAENNSIPNCGSSFQSGDPFDSGQPFDRGGGGGGGGGGFRRGIDEETLKQVADSTGGAYYSAESMDDLQQVFENLPTYLIAQHKTMEISAIFAAVGALLTAVAAVLSLLWHPLN